MWVIIATQDPQSVPREAIGLSTLTIVHRLQDKESLRELQRGSVAWDGITMADLAGLKQAEVWILATRASVPAWMNRPRKLKVRAPLSQPGGATRKATD